MTRPSFPAPRTTFPTLTAVSSRASARSPLLAIVIGALVALAGCDKTEETKKDETKKEDAKKDDAKKDAKASDKAATPAPAPAAENAIKVRANFEEYNGTYANGVWRKNHDGYLTLAFAKDCPTFGCEHWSSVGTLEDPFKTACPKGQVLKVEFKNDKEAKVGTNEAYIDISENGGGATLTARDSTAKIEITKLGDDSVVGTIDFGVDKEFETMAKGAFTAKVCAPPKEG